MIERATIGWVKLISGVGTGKNKEFKNLRLVVLLLLFIVLLPPPGPSSFILPFIILY